MQKLMEATVFEHVGGDAKSAVGEGDRQKLDKAAIESIYALQVVGITSYSNDDISEKCKAQLARANS
jgi:hypothetical protein